MSGYVPDLTVTVDLHVTDATGLSVVWWDETGGGEKCPWRATLHLAAKDGWKSATIYLDPPDLDRLVETLLAAQAEGRETIGAQRVRDMSPGPCQAHGCGHSYARHSPTGDGTCVAVGCPCDEYHEDPPGSGADPWGRTAEDMARSAE